MNVGGNVARLGTSIKEGLAPVVVYSFVLNGVLNILLFGQVLWYWKATAAVLKGSSSTSKAAPKATAAPQKTPGSAAKPSASNGPKTPASNNKRTKAD